MRPKLLIASAAVLLVGGTVAGLALAWGSAAKQPAANPGLPPATATVTRTTLVDTKTVSGTLGYGDPVPVGAAQAGRSWQADLGLPTTGVVEPGQVVVTPGVVRVAEHTARVGDRIGDARGGGAGGASVLSYTGTTKVVTVPLEVADRPLAVKGRVVMVTVPGQGPVTGTIAKVGTVATAPDQPGNAPADQTSSAPGASDTAAADARVQVTVTITDQHKLGSLDGAPVDVDFVSQQRKDVLAVPVAALLALPQGGYG